MTEHISIETQGAFNHTYLFNILIGAASNSDTIENTAKKLKKCCSGKNIRYHLAYAVYKVNISLDYIYQDYRKRFGIESSYRLKNFCRIRTTTKNPIIRLLFVGISFLLVNIWIYILWLKISHPRRGGL